MTLPRPPTLTRVAVEVGDVLRRHGISAALTGGACAALHTGGLHHSLDVDFVLTRPTTREALDAAMSSAGFRRDRYRYVHPRHPIVVEFPVGPLGIGDDLDVRPVLVRRGRAALRALSPTDACRDRLAAFFHWSDRQSLRLAAEIAVRNRVRVSAIRAWSAREDHAERFAEFTAEVRRLRAERRRGAPRRGAGARRGAGPGRGTAGPRGPASRGTSGGRRTRR